jgi:hypothetical protein
MNDETRGAVSETVEKTVEVAEETVRHPLVKRLARFGFYTKGVLFIVIGILAILLVIGLEGGKLADPTGAMGTIAQKPYGKFLLMVFVVGAIGHGVWNILRGAADVDDAGKDWKGIIKRIISIGVGIFYVGLAWSAWSIIFTAQVSAENGEVSQTLAAILLALPLGTILVLIIGLSVIGAGIHECYSGMTGKFQENFRLWEIEGNHLKFITILGALSFTARALILAMMGYFFITAAIYYDPNEAVGIDGALLTLSQSYFGKILLFITAVGVVCHGILAFYEAKYRRIC